MSGNRAAYWVATLLFTSFMAYNAFAYLRGDPRMMSAFARLGYPSYFPEILGVAKLLGVIALLVPAAPRLKEWAYAGFTFNLLGAMVSHVAVGQQGRPSLRLWPSPSCPSPISCGRPTAASWKALASVR